MDDDDDKEKPFDVDRATSEFTNESSCCWSSLADADSVAPANHVNYFFGASNDDFGWNLPPPSHAVAQLCSSGGYVDFDHMIGDADLAGNSSYKYASIAPDTAVVSATVTASGGGDVEAESQPVASSSSSEDPTEKSTVSGGSSSKPPTEITDKVKKKGQKRIRQARFAFMTKSEVDHLEDGYRWRKYGQKAVKNSPFPRSYYRCTNMKCTVKKRVERSSDDPTIVITTYEGQHCHHTVGYPRTGLINHESVFANPLRSSSSQFYYPGVQSPQETAGVRGSFHYSGDGGESHPLLEPTPQLSADKGLLDDMVPHTMRNS